LADFALAPLLEIAADPSHERRCSSDVHANAHRCEAEVELDPDNLLGGHDGGDWLREKALHIRLD